MTVLPRVRIGNTWVGPGEPCFMVAEIGACFRDIETGQALIRRAAQAGANAVKAQTFRAETLVVNGAYFTLEDGSRLSQYEYFKPYELSIETHRILAATAKDLGILFFSTPSHQDDVELLESLHVPVYKIGSDDLTNLPLLDDVARKGKPVIISTGMSDLGEVEQALATSKNAGNEAVILLHCVVGYPARIEEANLRAIRTLQNVFGVPVGFSDHLRSHVPDVAAVALGASMIEKHFVLDRSPGGPDYDVACTPDEFAAMVQAVREAERALGDGVKTIQPGEQKWREAARKSLIAAKDVEAGQVLSPQDLDVRRPASGIPPSRYFEILGRRPRCRINKGTVLQWDLL